MKVRDAGIGQVVNTEPNTAVVSESGCQPRSGVGKKCSVIFMSGIEWAKESRSLSSLISHCSANNLEIIVVQLRNFRTFR